MNLILSYQFYGTLQYNCCRKKYKIPAFDDIIFYEMMSCICLSMLNNALRRACRRCSGQHMCGPYAYEEKCGMQLVNRLFNT